MKSLRSFNDVHKVLAAFVPPAKAMHANYTLERMVKLMSHLGNPQDSYKVFHVAGTSGKTSTSYYLAAMLQAVGRKVGLTVSPHIDEVNERLQINLQPLTEIEFCEALSEFLTIVEESGVRPTYFELLIAFAYWEFARRKVDYAVVEVGLGGLLDCTNVITRADKICVIADIGLDHTQVLGKTIPEIAGQKAGIILPGNDVVMNQQSPEVMDIIDEVIKRQGGLLTTELIHPLSSRLENGAVGYQKRNWQLAYMTYNLAAKRDDLPRLDEEQINQTRQILIPARMEVVRLGSKTIIMDGAHNAQKMQAMANSLRTLFPAQKIACLFGLIKSGDFRLRSTLEQLVPMIEHMIITSFQTEQDLKRLSVEPARIVNVLTQFDFSNVDVIEDPKQAFRQLLRRPEPILLVTGSFFLMQYVRPDIKKIASNSKL